MYRIDKYDKAMKAEKNITITELPEKPLVRSLNKKQAVSTKGIAITAVILVAGVLSGWLLSRNSAPVSQSMTGSSEQTVQTKGGKNVVVGIDDAKTFRDSTEGKLLTGGVDGEGTHHLERPGGISQTVYLTSSVLDLSQFEGKQVRVWGETHSAKTAGWLMDVGKVEVIGN